MLYKIGGGCRTWGYTAVFLAQKGYGMRKINCFSQHRQFYDVFQALDNMFASLNNIFACLCRHIDIEKRSMSDEQNSAPRNITNAFLRYDEVLVLCNVSYYL